ncbi:MAG: helix-turn-helix transcriptional regulator [Actinomycetota bacterium]|nr:helix-turn-helix transcriptional regulator [Actinomycetota bacterium]
MDGDVDVAGVAALVGEPARARVLVALAGGRALAASTLAAEAGVAASTVSGHLARLVDGGLLCVEVSGRHRYYRLSRPEVAHVLEALAALAPARPVRSFSQATHGIAIRRARTCYDHLAGSLGVALFDALVAEGLLLAEPGDGGADPVLGAGRALQLTLTNLGRERLGTLGVALDPATRRPQLAYCVDWSEQRPHLAGHLGAALLARLVDLGWVVRRPRRVVTLTDAGRAGLADRLGVTGFE